MNNRKEKMPLPENMTPRREALKKLFSVWDIPRQTETLPLDVCLGRTLAETQFARFAVPPSHVSGCDGIAVRSADFQKNYPDTSHWQCGTEYVYADTGDDFPDDYDAVIPVEFLEKLPDGGIRITGAKSGAKSGEMNGEMNGGYTVSAGDNVRPGGSALREGDLLLEAGTVIRPMDLSLLAMGGAFLVPVWKKPKIAFLPTGSELIPWGTQPQRGQTTDSNSLMVPAMLREMGAAVSCFPIFRDVPDLLREELHNALQSADIVVINGGSSKGGEDFNTKLLASEGRLLFHEVSAAPGRPLAISMIGDKPVINVPGPPMAAYFVTDWCLRAIIDRWLCHGGAVRTEITGTLTDAARPGGPLETLRRFHAEAVADGSWTITPVVGAAAINANAQRTADFFEKKHDAGESLTVEFLR